MPPALRRRTAGTLLIGSLAFAMDAVVAPPVDDAPARVAALLHAHHASPVDVSLGEPIAWAIMAAEDEHFLEHSGIDAPAMVRAAWGRLIGEDLGGSTIDEQLAKLLYEGGHFTVASRIASLALAVKLETHFSKAAILSMYLNTVYYGHGFWGIAAASRGYFGVEPAALSWGQAALLAGLPQAPSALDPFVHPVAARQRQRYVLSRLVANGVLSQGTAGAAAVAPLSLRGS